MENMEKIKPTPKKEKKEEPWLDIYGETLIETEGGKVKITERKSGEVTERKIEKAEESDPYYLLNEFEQKRVNEELKKFEESKEIRSCSPVELTEEFAKKRESLAKKFIELRKENTEKSKE
ncbi:MAG: hypothetical protein Q7U68_01585 [Candidatus Roizmanbacteria bacterium]|nr:hypothetical protein [Candidatus Roizmanbacteria bacterium]